MSCTGLTNLEGTRFPSRYRAVPNQGEELFILGWDIVSKEVHRLREEGWELDTRGKKEQANHKYKAANIFFYLIYYGLIIRNSLQREGNLDQCFDYEGFNIDCVESNLPCLSKTFGTDYVNAWKAITDVFGIDRQAENCDGCCLGISGMIINNPDDCTSFIIGGCSENEQPKPPFGEFAPCEFVQNEVAQPIGPEEEIYGNCN